MFTSQIRPYSVKDTGLGEEKKKCYLKLLAEAIRVTSQNKGTLRKAIWEHFMANYRPAVDYRDFLLVIQDLERNGKIVSDNGYFKL